MRDDRPVHPHRAAAIAAAMVALAAICAMPPAAGAAKRKKLVTCSSGTTLLHAPNRVRVFRVVIRRATDVTSAQRRWYVCSRWLRTPKSFQNEVWADIRKSDLRIEGHRVVSAWFWDNGETGAWEMRWIDTRTGKRRLASLGSGDSAEEPVVAAFAVAPDGAMAYLDGGQDDEDRVGYVQTNRHRRTDTWTTLARLPKDSVVPRSLRFDGDVIRWQARDGTEGTVPVAAPRQPSERRAAAGSTRSASR
jgi:hypothetical protein